MDVLLSKNLEYLRKSHRKTQAEAASLLGLPRTTYVNYEKGETEPDYKTLLRISGNYGVGVTEILTIDLSQGQDLKKEKITGKPEKGQVLGQDLGQYLAEKPVDYTQFRRVFSPEVITVDSSGNENILRVPIKAKLGYAAHYNDVKFLQKLESYRLPGVRNGTYRMFDTEGPSMAPTIHGGDIVVGQYVESFSDVKDRRVYVIVTKDGYVIKRVLNRVSERGALVCLSDTVAHRLEYPTYQIDALEVRELWECKWKFSPNFAEPSDIYNRLNSLESDVSDLRLIVDDLRADLSDFKAPKRSK